MFHLIRRVLIRHFSQAFLKELLISKYKFLPIAGPNVIRVKTYLNKVSYLSHSSTVAASLTVSPKALSSVGLVTSVGVVGAVVGASVGVPLHFVSTISPWTRQQR